MENYDQTEEEKAQAHWDKMEAQSKTDQLNYLRDQFAMSALTAIIPVSNNGEGYYLEADVILAYEYADLMLAERDKRGKK